MTTQLPDVYRFQHLPIEPIPAGTNVLVTGPPMVGTRRLIYEMIADTGSTEGMLFISADEDCSTVLEDFKETGDSFDADRLSIIDCTEHGRATDSSRIRHVGSPSDLTGIGIEFSSLYETLRGNGITRARIGLSSIPTLLVYAEDFRAVYRFIHTVTSRIRTADGLGVFGIDPQAVDDDAFATVAQAFDARITVREGDDGPEFRMQGLPEQPEGWQRF